MNWLALAPYLVIAALGLAFGWEYVTVQERNVTIAQKDTALEGMRKQQAENMAKAVKAVSDDKAADAVKTTALVATLTKEKQDLEDRANVAETALAAVPEPVTPAGCPAPMDSPVLRSFIDGLPK